MNINFKLRDLLEAGMHLGHKTNKWNPNMDEYIYGAQDDIHIIDLRKTVSLLNNALFFIESIVKNNGLILFIGTKSQASDIVKKYAIECKQFYVNKRWLGGMLTNWSTISNSLNFLNSLNKKVSNENLRLKKKEILQMNRQIEKIEKYLGGLKDMGSTPQAIFVVDVNKDAIAVSEANKLKIPVIGILDTNSSPIGIDYPIPGNDDSRKSIELICSLISKIITKNKKKINFKENIVKKKLSTKIPKKEEVKRKLKKEKKTK
jgi:small subunit ribosomal protein S2